jgi:hypothetical protein
VVYIPKARTEDPEQPKSYRLINLTSFLLKTIEKLIDLHLHIRSKYLGRHPLQAGKSTVSALHHVVIKIEKALRYKEVAILAFVKNTGFESTRAAAVQLQLVWGKSK